MAGDISDLLAPELAMVGVATASKKALFQHLGSVAGAALGVDPGSIALSLAEREKLGSTGFGGGVAIPHGRIEGIGRIVVIVARLTKPFDFAAVDDVPVDIVVGMLSPPQAGAEHLKALARVSRRFRDRAFVDKLRGAGSRDAFWALLTADEARDAA